MGSKDHMQKISGIGIVVFPQLSFFSFEKSQNYDVTKIMTSHDRLILRRYMAENSKNVSTSKSKISIFMIFPENIAN